MKKSLKKFAITFLASALIIMSAPGTKALEESEYKIPGVAAYILTDAATGKVLTEYNAGKKLPMASVTKVMLLLLLAEDLDSGKAELGDTVTVSPYASSMTGSVIWLEPNEKMELSELAKSIVISSANDAAVAVAEYLSGSEEEFVKRMNRKANELSMNNTNFMNVVGYDEENHYTTARDASIMTAELFSRGYYAYYGDFMKTRLSSVRTGTEKETQLLNTNKLAVTYDGLLGGKTGTTDKAGYCVAECAERDGFRLISVVLGAKNDEDRTALSEFLLDTGFTDYQVFTPEMDFIKLQPLKVEGGVYKTVDIELTKLPRCVIPRGSGSKITYEYNIPESVKAPVKRGDVVGQVTAMLGNDIVFTSDAAITEDVAQMTLYKSFQFMLRSFFRF